MDTELGYNLIVWTVRASVLLYVLAVWRFLFHSDRSTAPEPVYRIAWTASWLLCVVHVVFAYHFEHHWNQAAALKHTAEMTERVVGLHWSGGLYVNYIFLTLWGIDAARLFRVSAVGSSLAMHCVAAFMMFNATAVFGPVWWWIPFTAVMIAVAWRWRNGSQRSSDGEA